MAETVLATPAKRWAREYELIYILKPNVDPDDAEKVARRVQEIIAASNGKLTKVDIWGKRKLAYSIDRHTRGIFIYLTFVGFGEAVAELERNLRLAEPVIRYQTIVARKGMDLEGVEIDESEIEFARIEHDENEEAELTTAQRLGMEERRPTPPAEAEKAEGEAAEGEAAEGEATEAKAEGEAAEGEKAEAADATEGAAEETTSGDAAEADASTEEE